MCPWNRIDFAQVRVHASPGALSSTRHHACAGALSFVCAWSLSVQLWFARRSSGSRDEDAPSMYRHGGKLGAQGDRNAKGDGRGAVEVAEDGHVAALGERAGERQARLVLAEAPLAQRGLGQAVAVLVGHVEQVGDDARPVPSAQPGATTNARSGDHVVVGRAVGLKVAEIAERAGRAAPEQGDGAAIELADRGRAQVLLGATMAEEAAQRSAPHK